MQNLFEDFKEKVGKLQNKHHNEVPLNVYRISAWDYKEIKERGNRPDNFTIQQLFPETVYSDGNDLSLMSGPEWEIMITYAKARKYLLEKYP